MKEVVVVADVLKIEKKTTSGSRLDVREVVVMAAMLKIENRPPPARV